MAAIDTTNDLAEIINNHINQGTEKADSIFSGAYIYRVPEQLRKGKEMFYTPRLVSIGPLHCNDEHLRPMQDVKKSYTNHLIRRLTQYLPEERKQQKKRIKVLQDCVKELKNRIDEVKKFYAEVVTTVTYQEKGKEEVTPVDMATTVTYQEKGKEEVTPVDMATTLTYQEKGKEEVTPVVMAEKYDGEDFNLSDDGISEMMLVDGCFILEFFNRSYELAIQRSKIRVEGEGGERSSGASVSSDLSTPLLPVRNEANMEKRQGPGDCPRMESGMNPGESSSSKKPFDPLFDRLFPLNTVINDMLLLENQIPFFILEILFEHIVKKIPNRPNKYSLTEYVSRCFGGIMFTKDRKNPERENGCYNHILHKLHEDYRWESSDNKEHALANQKDKKKHPESIPRDIPCASELEYAGVKFVPGTGNTLLKLNFTKPKGPFSVCQRAQFEIPPLQIYDNTELLLRNFIAYEQCCPSVPRSSFTTYAYLMDMLVNSEKDIQVLEKAGVMCNYLGASQDATDLFTKLCKETIVVTNQEPVFAALCDEVLVYSESCWPKNLAHIERTYFASPWTFIAFCVGIITFVLAVISFCLTFL